MVYQQVLRNGEKVGNYSIKSTPGKTAEKIAKQVYMANDWKGEKTFDITFVKNNPFKAYDYKVNVLPVNEKVYVGSGYVNKRYDIQVRRM